MDQHIALVKRQIAWLVEQTTRFSPDHPRYRADLMAMYDRLLAEHRELLYFLEQLKISAPELLSDVGDSHKGSGSKREDLSDLPEELLAELSGKAAKGAADPLVQIITDRGGVASLDEILIDLYRKHRQIGKRVLVQNKLYRLAKQGVVRGVPGRKGVYTTTQLQFPGLESQTP